MFRELFTVPGTSFTIYSYGLMLVIAALSAIQLGKFLARRFAIDPEFFVNLGIIALVSGVLGARISHIFENWNTYFGPEGSGFLQAINLRTGGLTYYGGVLLGVPVCIAFGLWKKIPLRRGMDIAAPCLLVGLAIGRIGCLANGCCWGGVCDLPWAVQYPFGSPAFVDHVDTNEIALPAELLAPIEWVEANQRLRVPAYELQLKQLPTALQQVAHAQHSASVHPTQIYSTITAGLIAATLVAYLTLLPTPGTAFALMCIFEGAGRFLIEMMRVNKVILHIGNFPLTYSMTIGAGLFVLGFILFAGFTLYARVRKPESLLAN